MALRQINLGEFIVTLETGETSDGEPFIRLGGVNCDLCGEEPGLYFPRHPNHRPDISDDKPLQET